MRLSRVKQKQSQWTRGGKEMGDNSLFASTSNTFDITCSRWITANAKQLQKLFDDFPLVIQMIRLEAITSHCVLKQPPAQRGAVVKSFTSWILDVNRGQTLKIMRTIVSFYSSGLTVCPWCFIIHLPSQHIPIRQGRHAGQGRLFLS